MKILEAPRVRRHDRQVDMAHSDPASHTPGREDAAPAHPIEQSPDFYDALRRAAQRCLNAERAGHTLSATALVHEAYLRLAGSRNLARQDQARFYAAAAEAFRRILIDHARARGRQKRGGHRVIVDLNAGATLADTEPSGRIDYVALDEALCRLKEQDARAAQIVNLRYFAGLSFAVVANMLDVSERTAKNDWAFAKAWLARELDR